MALIAQLKPSSFEWVTDSRSDIGFIAQDVEAVLPQIVSTDADGIKGIGSIGILATLVAAFNEYVSTHP